MKIRQFSLHNLSFSFCFFAILVVSFLIGYFSNITNFQYGANLLNKAYASSFVDSICLCADLNMTEPDFSTIQKNVSNIVSSGWPNNTFSILPMYNVDDCDGLRVCENNQPLVIIPNSEWNTHVSTSGTGYTLKSYDFSLEQLESVNDKGIYDNFCYISENMANKISKQIGDIITIQYGDNFYSYIIRNIIINGVSTARGMDNVFGENYIVANQNDISAELKAKLSICKFISNSNTSFLSLINFRNNLARNSSFRFHHYDKSWETKISFLSETKIVEVMNKNWLQSLPICIPLIAVYLILIILLPKMICSLEKSSFKKTFCISASCFAFVILIEILLRCIVNNVKYFSIVGAFLTLLSFGILLIIYFNKSKTC